ncbi:hypothetical protein NKG05_27695 [Oerskovia sp. M15]
MRRILPRRLRHARTRPQCGRLGAASARSAARVPPGPVGAVCGRARTEPAALLGSPGDECGGEAQGGATAQAGTDDTEAPVARAGPGVRIATRTWERAVAELRPHRGPIVAWAVPVVLLTLLCSVHAGHPLAVLPASVYLAVAGTALAVIDVRTHRLPNALVLPSYPVLAVLLGTASLPGPTAARPSAHWPAVWSSTPRTSCWPSPRPGSGSGT